MGCVGAEARDCCRGDLNDKQGLGLVLVRGSRAVQICFVLHIGGRRLRWPLKDMVPPITCPWGTEPRLLFVGKRLDLQAALSLWSMCCCTAALAHMRECQCPRV